MSSLDHILKSLPLTDDNSYVLIVGGLGYIGSHTTLELLKEGYNVVVVDNLSNSFEGVLQRIKLLATEYCHTKGRKLPSLKFHQADFRSDEMRRVLDNYAQLPIDTLSPVEPSAIEPRRSYISGLIHFAAFKSVEDSIKKPLSYYQNNVCGLVDFLVLLEEYDIRTFIFSSSATVYGAKSNEGKPLREEDLVHHHERVENDNGKTSMRVPGVLGLQSPYGRSKYFSEAILADLAFANPIWKIVALRYFNPVGCHESGLLGEDPRQKPTNLFPVITQVLMGSRPVLEVFGTDWDTHDGTAIRDFIHVVDLARGHVAALEAALSGSIREPFRAFNIGTGKGSSVSDVVRSVEAACDRSLPVVMAGRRAGDIGYCVAATDRVQKELSWEAERSIYDAAKDGWNFVSRFNEADSTTYRDPFTRRPSL